MKRREFIALVGGAVATRSLAARAQQPAMPMIGFLNSASRDGYAPQVSAFRLGLTEVGYVEAQNVTIEFRWAEGHYDRLQAMAADLVRRRVNVIVANTPGNLVAKAATSTIPIIFTTGSDPVKLGLVASLSHPGGNVTGATQLTDDMGPKRLQLAHEFVPTARVIGVLINPTNPKAEAMTRDFQTAAVTLGLQISVLHASTEVELDVAFTTFRQMGGRVLVIGTDAFYVGQAKLLAALAIRDSIPAIYEFEPFVAAGGLVSYGGSITDSYHQAGVYTGRVLKGDKPADLPVQQATKVELSINLRTARALGITVPLALIGRADEVIE